MEATTSTVFEQSPSHVSKETPLRRSSRSSSGESGNILQKECIFCHKEKYQKCSNQREALSSCMLLQADKKIRDIATKRNDSAILAITCDELIAKEAHYHFPCYREYTREPSCSITTDLYEDTEQPESDMMKVVDFLNELSEKPDIIPLTTKSCIVVKGMISGCRFLKRIE